MPTLQQFNQEEEKITYDAEKARSETMLAIFIDFVESEAKRIDEETRLGVHRRDGGRKMMCMTFLKQLLASHDARRDEELRKMIQAEKIGQEGSKEEIYSYASYNQAINKILSLLSLLFPENNNK